MDKIKNLFKKVKLESTKPSEIDFILKKSNIDINTIYKPIGGYTLFEYCIKHTNNITLIDYLYENSNKILKGNELSLAVSRSKRTDIKLLNWLLTHNMIISENFGGFNSKNHLIPYLLPHSKEKIKNKNELFKFIETNFNNLIYEKDVNNNTLLHLYLDYFNEDSFKWIINFLDIYAINNKNETALEKHLKEGNLNHFCNFHLFFKYDTKLNFNILEYIIYMKHPNCNEDYNTENCCIYKYKCKIYIMTLLLKYNYIIPLNKNLDLDLHLSLLLNSNFFEVNINRFNELIEMYKMFFNLVKDKNIKDENIMINTDKFL